MENLLKKIKEQNEKKKQVLEAIKRKLDKLPRQDNSMIHIYSDRWNAERTEQPN